MSKEANEKYLSLKVHGVFANIIITLATLVITTVLSYYYVLWLPEHHGMIYLFYILAVTLVALLTTGYFYGTTAALCSVICINYMFTYPFFKLNFTLAGYPLTFALLLSITLLICTMTTHLCKQASIIKERETQLRDAALEKMRANLLRAVSHDLRTPLTAIIGNSSIYLENEDSLSKEEKREMVSSIYNGAGWLLNMVENLLTITRIQGDNLQINTSVESVEEVVSEALMRLSKRFPDAEIRASVPDEMLFVPMDAILIEQVIINLTENAIVHADSKKPIELIVSDSGKKVTFTIKDYGHGIPEAMLDKLFDGTPYHKDESSDTHKGMGIGLSICKTIITAHRGEIYGENHGEGAQFCFILPKGEIHNES